MEYDEFVELVRDNLDFFKENMRKQKMKPMILEEWIIMLGKWLHD